MASVPWRPIWTIIFLMALMSLAHAQLKEGDRCLITTNGSIGVCRPVSNCLEFIRGVVKSGLRPTICNNYAKMVCCKRPGKTFRPNYDFGPATPLARPQAPPPRRPQVSETKKSISERMCEAYSKSVTRVLELLPLLVDDQPEAHTVPKCTFNSAPLIVGGDEAIPGEFPHMVAVGFPIEGRIEWNCGGTLVSEKFVVTAGHCAWSRETSSAPSVVRVGAHDLQADERWAVDHAVSRIETHPEYRRNAVYQDIALLELAQSVIFSNFVRPACLWQRRPIAESKAIATGWGNIADSGKKRSLVLLKVILNLIDSKTCQEMVREHATKKFNRLIDEQLCAADTVEKKKDTCQGDSGGPLVFRKPDNLCISYLIGVTSFGKKCAGNFPGIYTRISSYIPWIESIVWPGEA